MIAATACAIMFRMRPNKHRLLKPKVGDIVLNIQNQYHYLILDVKLHDDSQYYEGLNLETGTHQFIGYYNYLYKTLWEIVK